MTTSRYGSLTREQLAVLVPELLLIGQLIDRAGMAWCIAAWGREEMAQIAIEEWAGASPIYTRRMQRALDYAPEVEGAGDVVTIFKGLQLDIGAPPQFMDFRYEVQDRWHGTFHLDHCGAMMDVEPMGPEYVRSMCHDIEDPTFDATAVASNPRAQVRPIHRPPRLPADRHPHCAWTVAIDDTHPVVEPLAPYHQVRRTAAATVTLDPIDPADEGAADYSGPLVSDIAFADFSHSALVRIADEVCLQMHLLNLSFTIAVRVRSTDEAQAEEIYRKQFVGIAAIAAERIKRALGLGSGAKDALRVMELHPAFNPAAYVHASFSLDSLTVTGGPAAQDSGWLALCGPGRTSGLQSLVRAIDPHLDVDVAGSEESWSLRVVERADAAEEVSEVAVVRFSTGPSFEFEARRSIPITPV